MAKFGVFVLGAYLLFAALPASAQVSATTGSINGKVTDESGAVLPGVTVTVASPSMQGIRTAVTDDSGDYRFPAVPPGDYRITYELVGFGTVDPRRGARRPRVHRHGERRHEGRQPPGDGHGRPASRQSST